MKIFNFLKFRIKKGTLLGLNFNSEKIEVPYGVTKISSNAFLNKDVNEIVLKNGVKTLEDNCFSKMKNLNSVKLPDTIKNIGKYVFRYNYNLKEIRLPKNLSVLPEGTFIDCYKLKNITSLPQLTLIEKKAFCGCYELKKFDFGKNLNNIDVQAFWGCGIEVVDLQDTKITTLSSGAFGKCFNLKTVITNPLLSEIKDGVFGGCESLENIKLNEGLIRLGREAFKKTAIKNIVLPQSLNNIEAKCFYGCTSLENIELPKNLKKITFGCFSYCNNLKKIIIPETVYEIEEEAFCSCKSLNEIRIPMTINKLKDSTFAYCSNLKKVIIENPNIKISKKAFCGCNNLEEIVYKQISINVTNVEISNLDDETLQYCLENNDNFKYLKAKIPVDCLKELDSIGLINEFYNTAYYKNYRNLYNKIFSSNLGNMENKKAFFILCYNLGIFDKELSQKSTELVASIIQNGIIQSFNVEKFVGELTLNRIDKEMIKTITDSNVKFFYDACVYSKGNKGFLGKCLKYYELVQETNTTNKGSHRRLKPTLNKFINYFNLGKFDGVTTKEEEDLAIEVGKFFDKQEIFDRAKKVMSMFKENEIQESIISESVRKEIFDKIDIFKKRTIESEEDFKHIIWKLHYEFLKKNDPLNLTVGKYCSLCCAHLEGVGEPICFASVLDENTQTLVIKNNFNEIVSKAVFTINKEEESVIINSVQINKALSIKNEKGIVKKYLEAMMILIDDYNKIHQNKIYKIYMGTSKSELVNYFQPYSKSGNCESIDYNKYRIDYFSYKGDWMNGQICIYDSKMQLK